MPFPPIAIARRPSPPSWPRAQRDAAARIGPPPPPCAGLPNLSARSLESPHSRAEPARTFEAQMTEITATQSAFPDAADDPAAQLLAAIARGDRAAFERLYRDTSARLFGVCLRVLPERAEAEDVLQEVYATVWRKAGQFDAGRASASVWLAMIARNKAIDRLRALPSLRRAPLEAMDEIADAAPTPSARAESEDDNERLRRCLDELDARRRGLIRTAFFDGCTYEELAQRTGSPLGSVKSWIRRGLIQLRACLER